MADSTTINGLIKVTISLGDSSSGNINISAPGVKSGDILLAVVQIGGSDPLMTDTFFDHIVATDGYIVQLQEAGDLSGSTSFEAILCRFA